VSEVAILAVVYIGGVVAGIGMTLMFGWRTRRAIQKATAQECADILRYYIPVFAFKDHGKFQGAHPVDVIKERFGVK
jgi:hypothetical protein